MSWHLLLAVVCSALYGLVYVVAGFAQLRNKQLEPQTGMLLSLAGALTAVSAVLLTFGAGNAPWVLAIGLLGIHGVTYRNGLKLHGRVTRSHHLVRLALALGLLALAVWGLY